MADAQDNRLLTPTLDSEGRVIAKAVITPEEDAQRCDVIFRSKIIPVLFIPGIMGSNLKFAKEVDNNKEGAPAWAPPNGKLEGIRAVNTWKWRSPAKRQIILNPATTTVHSTDNITFPNREVLAAPPRKGQKQQDPRLSLYRDRRFWGELHQESYGEFIAWLEDTLNAMPVKLEEPNWIGELEGKSGEGAASGNPVTERPHLSHATNYSYPVHVYGYNWLESNAVSAQKMDKRIDTILAECKKQDPTCEKVLLVTHSMGGLVARAYTNTSMQKVLGVVHGVMPSTGAPVFYKRMRAGFSGESRSNILVRLLSLLFTGHSDPEAALLGADAAHTSPVIASAPGALELAPWGNYNNGKPWLRVIDTATGEQFSIGGDAIYGDVYANTTAWYGMLPLRAEEVDAEGNNTRYDPAGLVKKANPGKTLGKVFEERIKKIQDFQKVHANSYPTPRAVFWGHDEDEPTYHECVWEGVIPPGVDEAALRAAILVADDMQGTLTLNAGGKVFTVKLRKAVGKGEGTVPVESAKAAAEGAFASFEQPGYDHQMSYGDKHAQWAVLYSIVHLVQNDARAKHCG